jgi:hypothetical protein
MTSPSRTEEFPFRSLVFRDRDKGETIDAVLYLSFEFIAPSEVKAIFRLSKDGLLYFAATGSDAWQAVTLGVSLGLKAHLGLLNRDYSIIWSEVEWDPVTGDWPLGDDDAGAEDGV